MSSIENDVPLIGASSIQFELEYAGPEHTISGGLELDAPLLNDDKGAVAPATQRRWQTIASIVNTMMGTTIVALPFGLAESGLGVGLGLMVLLGSISCYTCLILVDAGEGSVEFSDCVRRYLGVKPQLVAWAMSVAIIFGAAIVYHILMAETLYDLVTALIQAAQGAGAIGGWRREYAALIPWLLYPISNNKDMSLLVKLNSGGALFLWYTIIFVAYHGFHALAAGPLHAVATLPAGDPAYRPDGSLNIVLLGKLGFGQLGGMLALSFFAHNVVQPIVKNAAPATKKADIAIGYLIAGLLYAIVGALGYVGFADAHTAAECSYSPGSDAPCVLKSNFLAMFGTDFADGADAYAFTARVSLLFQLFTVFPLLLLIIRNQLFVLLYQSAYPSYRHVALLNFVIMAVTFTFAALDLQISQVLGFTGAIGGFVIVFAVPLAIDYVRHEKDEAGLSTLRLALYAFILAIGLLFLILQFIPIATL